MGVTCLGTSLVSDSPGLDLALGMCVLLDSCRIDRANLNVELAYRYLLQPR